MSASQKPTTSSRPAAHELVLVQSRLDAGASLAPLDALSVLTKQMWIEQMVPVEQLYRELVDDANGAARAAGDRGFRPGGNDGYLRLLHLFDGLLVVELEETRIRSDSPSDALKSLCANIVRYIERDRTITRCTLGPEHARPFSAAGAL